jgi:hypothetical protein
MNHSMYSADQMTHLKVVVIALVAGIGIAGFGILTRITIDDGSIQTAQVIKTDPSIQDTKFALALPHNLLASH